jgi:hypothetical protein
MPESTSPPTFFANIATIHVNVDEVGIEFRRLLKPHIEVWRALKDTQLIPSATEEEIYQTPPAARVVLTFLAAMNLRDNLVKLLSTFEQKRKEGEK